MNIVQAIKDVDNVLINLNSISVEAIMENKAEIIDLNTSQLSIGLNAQGEQISPEYQNPDYAKLKKSIGSKASLGIPDLKLEGDFYSGFDIVKRGDMAWIDSKDEKTPKLERKYDFIFGIMPRNWNEFLRIIFPSLRRKVLNRLN